MHNSSQRAPLVVGALTTWVERWVSQDVARVNAATAASRLRRQRAELEDVDMFLAAQRPRGIGQQGGDQTPGRRSGRP